MNIIKQGLELQAASIAVKDFGWANDWGRTGGTPGLVLACQQAHHKVSDVDVGPPMRGMEHVVRCDQCGYIYRYDSSD